MSNNAPVEVTWDQAASAHALAESDDLCDWWDEGDEHSSVCRTIARAFAERDRAAELRGAEKAFGEAARWARRRAEQFAIDGWRELHDEARWVEAEFAAREDAAIRARSK